MMYSIISFRFHYQSWYYFQGIYLFTDHFIHALIDIYFKFIEGHSNSKCIPLQIFTGGKSHLSDYLAKIKDKWTWKQANTKPEMSLSLFLSSLKVIIIWLLISIASLYPFWMIFEYIQLNIWYTHEVYTTLFLVFLCSPIYLCC